MKYNMNTKLEVVNKYLNGSHSYRELANRYGIGRTTIRDWVNQYLRHGEDGIVHVGKNYSGEFKIHVVEYMHEHRLSLTQTMYHFNVRVRNNIVRWKEIYEKNGPEGLLKKHEKPE